MTQTPVLTLAALALALAGSLAGAPARAAPQVSVHIGLPLPVLQLPLPVLRAPVVIQAPVYAGPAWRAGYDRHGRYDSRYGSRDDPRHRPPPPAWRDRDRDGIPDWRDGYDNRQPPPAWRGRNPGPDRGYDNRPDWNDRRW